MAESVLVVDDDPDVARFVEVNLRSAGYEVTVASNGEEGFDKAVELRPDLVLLDVMMPKRDRFEVAQRRRRDPRTPLTASSVGTGPSRPWPGWSRRPSTRWSGRPGSWATWAATTS